MKSWLKMTLVSTAIVFSLAACDDKNSNASQSQVVQLQQKEIKTLEDIELNKTTESYAVGASFGEYLKTHLERNSIALDDKFVLQGFNDAFNGKAFYSTEQVQYILENLDSRVQQERTEKFQQEKTANVAAGEKFRQEFAAQPGVKQTESGLLYQIITPGTDKHPTIDDTVTVNYTGTLIDGTKFDSSIDRNEPAQFPLAGVIPGWQEGITLIGEGGKIKLVIPPELAYGEQGIPGYGEYVGIPPESTLVFEVDLLKVGEEPASNN